MTDLMPTPRYLDLEITSCCNARCRYCYYLNNQGVNYADLPTQRWLEFFEEASQAQVMQVCLSGGEPFLREDIFELIDGIVRCRMRYQVLTNGRSVTREVARRLKASGRLASIQVSLDGSRPETHESMRGEGSFAPALEAIRVLHDEKLPVTVRVTVHGQNIDDLPALTRLLLEEVGLLSFSTNAVSSLGTHAKYGDDVFLTPALRLRAMHVLAALSRAYPGRIEASAGPLADWMMFQEMEAARKAGEPIPDRGKLVGCGCILFRMAVRADGAYIPCVMLPQTVLGYVGQDSLGEVWRGSAEFNELRERIHVPLQTFAECQDCEYLDLCTGSCAGVALSLTGDARRPSPQACLRRFNQELEAEGLSLWQE
jgi:SynChlorMet cassette radical SAM/SPASM protein ScmE